MTPRHHPTDEYLLDYAAGSTTEPVALVIASHLTFCPDCRARARMLDGIGGCLLETIEPTPVAARSFGRLLERLGEARMAPAPSASKPSPLMETSIFPRPMAAYVMGEPSVLPWRRVVRGVDECPLTMHDQGRGTLKTALLRIAGGRGIPRHTHRGVEMLLVLDGSFSDETGHYARGDVQIADEALVHRPIADAGRDCVCLTVVEGPIRLTGPLARFLNPFLGG